MSRPLAEVLLDLMTTRREWNAEAEKVPVDTIDDDLLTTLDDKLDSLRIEFRDVFKERTGVAWSNVDAAIMEGAL